MDTCCIGTYRCLNVLRSGPFFLAYLHQFAAGKGHTAVVFQTQAALDNELKGHACSIGELLYFRHVFTGHAGRGTEDQGGGCAGSDNGRLDTQHLGYLFSRPRR